MTIEDIKKKIISRLDDINNGSDQDIEEFTLEWVLDMLALLEEEYVGPADTREIYDGVIIRVGNEVDGWYYEVCYKDELETMSEMEIIPTNEIHISNKILERILSVAQFSPDGEIEVMASGPMSEFLRNKKLPDIPVFDGPKDDQDWDFE